jgi:hypothetical protein
MLLNLPLIGGVDNSTEPTVAHKPTVMENCYYSKVSGVQRRYGLTKQNTNSTIDIQASQLSDNKYSIAYNANTTPLALSTCESEIYLQGDANVWKFEPSEACWLHADTQITGTAYTQTLGAVSGTIIDDSVTTPRIIGVDSVVCNGYVGVTWVEEFVETSGTTYHAQLAMVYRVSTGEVVMGKTYLDTVVSGAFVNRSSRVTKSGNYIVFLYSSTGANILAASFDTAKATNRVGSFPDNSAPDFSVGALTGTLRAFDVAWDRSGSGSIAVLTAEDGGWNLYLQNSSGASTGSATNFATIPNDAEGFAVEFDTYVYVAFDNASGLQARTYDNTAAAVSAITTIDATRPRKVTLWPNSTTDITIIYNQQTAAYYTKLIALRRTSSTMANAETLMTGVGYGCLLASKGTRTSIGGPAGIKFLSSPMGKTSSDVLTDGATAHLTWTYIDRDIDAFWDPLLIASVEATGGLLHNGKGSDGANTCMLPLPSSSVGTTKLFAAYPFGPDVDTARLSSVKLGSLETLDKVNTVSALRCSFSSGGVIRCYDGQLNQEVGLLAYPYITAASAAAGGSLTANASYIPSVIFAFVNAKNLTWRSAPAVTTAVTPSGANLLISMTASVMSMTARFGVLRRPRLEFFRTLANQEDYYAEKVVDVPETALGSVTVTLSLSDTAASDNAQIYTEGGVLENVAPPGGTCLALHNQRLWVGGTPDDTIWYSKEFVTEEMPGFNEGLTIQPFEGGRVIALASLDTVLAIFKQNGIYAISGQGPDDKGESSSYSQPQKVQADTGCIDKMSVVSTPLGIFFRGRRGLYLLDRALSVKYVGRPIEDVLTSSVTITDSVYYEKDSQVWFFTDTNSVYVYDLLNDAWSVFKFKVTGGSDLNPRVGCILDGDLYIVNSSLNLYKYDRSKYLDEDYYFTETYRTQFSTQAPPQAAGLPPQGWYRIRNVYVKGTVIENAGATVTLYYNWDTETSSSRTWTATEASATGDTYNRQYRIVPGLQKCQSIAVQYQSTTPTAPSTGGGIRLQSILLEVEPYDRPAKRRSNAQK